MIYWDTYIHTHTHTHRHTHTHTQQSPASTKAAHAQAHNIRSDEDIWHTAFYWMSLKVSVGKQNDDRSRWQPAWMHILKPHVDNWGTIQWISLSGCTTCSSFSLKSGYIILRSIDIFPSGQCRHVVLWHRALCQLVRDAVVPAKANSVGAPVLLCQAPRKTLPLQSTVFRPRPTAARSYESSPMLHVLLSALFTDEALVSLRH